MQTRAGIGGRRVSGRQANRLVQRRAGRLLDIHAFGPQLALHAPAGRGVQHLGQAVGYLACGLMQASADIRRRRVARLKTQTVQKLAQQGIGPPARRQQIGFPNQGLRKTAQRLTLPLQAGMFGQHAAQPARVSRQRFRRAIGELPQQIVLLHAAAGQHPVAQGFELAPLREGLRRVGLQRVAQRLDQFSAGGVTVQRRMKNLAAQIGLAGQIAQRAAAEGQPGELAGRLAA